MAGKVGSNSFSVLLVDGYDMLAAKVKNFTHRVTSILEPSDGLGDSWAGVTPVGMKRAELTQEGAFFDDSSNTIHAAFNASVGVSRILCFAYAGNAKGKPMVGLQGTYGMSYDVLGQLAGLTKANVGYSVSGQLDNGVIVQELAA